MIDTVTRRQVDIAMQGTRGDVVRATSDGRVLLSQSTQIDVLNPIVSPRVIATSPPRDAHVLLPVGQVIVTFDQPMYDADSQLSSVLNPDNYSLMGEQSGTAVISSVTYDAANDRAVLNVDSLVADQYTLTVKGTLESAGRLPLAADYETTFLATADVSAAVDLQFTTARADRSDGTVSYDVALSNIGSTSLVLPFILVLNPRDGFEGIPQDAVLNNAVFFVDLADSLPDNGELRAGQSITGRTITIENAGQRIAFDASLTARPAASKPPTFDSQPTTEIFAGRSYEYNAAATDPDGDPVVYLLANAPQGMQIDPISGQITWVTAPSYATPAHVELHVYDDHGSRAIQRFDIDLLGANQPPHFVTVSPPIFGREGGSIDVTFEAVDPDGDPLFGWIENIPAGAFFDPLALQFQWKPTYEDAGIYSNARLVVSDGLLQTSQPLLLVIEQGSNPPILNQPPDYTAVEGSRLTFGLQARSSTDGSSTDGLASAIRVHNCLPELCWTRTPAVSRGLPLTSRLARTSLP